MKTDVKTISIPVISDELLAQRIQQIKYVTTAMQGVDGKAYSTSETNQDLYDLFYVKTDCDPRTEAFNFGDSKIKEKATGLKTILVKDIFVKIGGYHGFCKITYAEVFSQLPEEIASEVVAFSLDPNSDPQILNGDYQSTSIIFYRKETEITEKDNNLLSYKDLVKSVNLQKAKDFCEKILPILFFSNSDLQFVHPGDINKPFMRIGIWMRVNGSNLHENNDLTPVDVPYKLGEKFSVYQPFETGADIFIPTYAYLISQVPEHLLNENVIGLRYHSTDYFKTKEGVLHKTEYTIVEKA